MRNKKQIGESNLPFLVFAQVYVDKIIEEKFKNLLYHIVSFVFYN